MCNQGQLPLLGGKVFRIFPAEDNFHPPRDNTIQGGTPDSPLIAGGARGGLADEAEGMAVSIPSPSDFTLVG